MNTCAGCGLLVLKAYGGGLWIRPDGKAVEYILCELCAIERKHDPEGMMDAIELNLSRVEGNA